MTVNGAEQNISGYSIGLYKGSEEIIGFSLKVHNILNGLFVKKGTDEEGDIYEAENLKETMIGVNGQIAEDELSLFSAVGSAKRIKFNDQFDKLTIISNPNVVSQFKKYIPKNEPYVITDSLLR